MDKHVGVTSINHLLRNEVFRDPETKPAGWNEVGMIISIGKEV